MIARFVARVFEHIRTPQMLHTHRASELKADDLRACATDSLQAAARAQAQFVLRQQFAPALGLRAPARPQGLLAQAQQIGTVGALAAHKSYVANPRCPPSEALAQGCARVLLCLTPARWRAPAPSQATPSVPTASATSLAPAAAAAARPSTFVKLPASSRPRPTALVRPMQPGVRTALSLWQRGWALLRG